MKTHAALFALALALASCTPYQPAAFRGGYTDWPVPDDPQAFHVHYQSNGFTPMERTMRMAVYRCAELSLQHGARRFEILGATQGWQRSIENLPGTFQSETSPSFPGARSTVTTTGTYTAPGTIVHETHPHVDLAIRLLRDQEPDGPRVIDARALMETLGPRIGR